VGAQAHPAAGSYPRAGPRPGRQGKGPRTRRTARPGPCRTTPTASRMRFPRTVAGLTGRLTWTRPCQQRLPSVTLLTSPPSPERPAEWRSIVPTTLPRTPTTPRSSGLLPGGCLATSREPSRRVCHEPTAAAERWPPPRHLPEPRPRRGTKTDRKPRGLPKSRPVATKTSSRPAPATNPAPAKTLPKRGQGDRKKTSPREPDGTHPSTPITQGGLNTQTSGSPTTGARTFWTAKATAMADTATAREYRVNRVSRRLDRRHNDLSYCGRCPRPRRCAAAPKQRSMEGPRRT
jgi:hypothetical protein